MEKINKLDSLYKIRNDLLQKDRLLKLNLGDNDLLYKINFDIDKLELEAPKMDEIDFLFIRTSKLCFEMAYNMSRNTRRQLRETRLRLLGFEEVTEEQRRDNLKLNMALKKWTKE